MKTQVAGPQPKKASALIQVCGGVQEFALPKRSPSDADAASPRTTLPKPLR